MGDLPKDHVLCQVWAVHIYLDLTSLLPHPRSLVCVTEGSFPFLSKNALSFFLRQVIVDADSLWEGSSPSAYSILGVTICPFCGTGRSPRCLRRQLGDRIQFFGSFYFWDLSFSLDGCSSLGPFVAAGSVLSSFLSLVFHSWFGGMTADLGWGPLFFPCSPTGLLMGTD